MTITLQIISKTKLSTRLVTTALADAYGPCIITQKPASKRRDLPSSAPNGHCWCTRVPPPKIIYKMMSTFSVQYGYNQRNKGNTPHWCKKPSPVVTSRTNSTSTASIAALPFQVSALFVHPHSQTITGGGSSLRCESYVASNSSTLPRGTSDCRGNISCKSVICGEW